MSWSTFAKKIRVPGASDRFDQPPSFKVNGSFNRAVVPFAGEVVGATLRVGAGITVGARVAAVVRVADAGSAVIVGDSTATVGRGSRVAHALRTIAHRLVAIVSHSPIVDLPVPSWIEAFAAGTCPSV